MKGQSRFGKKGKLSPCYIGPFQILERLSPVVYGIALPLGMEQMQYVFYVSMLKGYLWDPFHVIDYYQIALDENMENKEWPEQIIDWKVKQLRNKSIPMVKVEWKEHYGRDAMQEKEDKMQQHYPYLFPTEGEQWEVQPNPSVNVKEYQVFEVNQGCLTYEAFDFLLVFFCGHM
ncbi:uncharacterized protein LOC114321873 [Camellia sinensis]|uniref:uncharacterized protein LOC114321873 n=1 Tax=Camellia sinensis TaxID=4442 RepID=UPI001036C7C5|nr:uncharacterized protein LOC114321873 [Camellia sinensis]